MNDSDKAVNDRVIGEETRQSAIEDLEIAVSTVSSAYRDLQKLGCDSTLILEPLLGAVEALRRVNAHVVLDAFATPNVMAVVAPRRVR